MIVVAILIAVVALTLATAERGIAAVHNQRFGAEVASPHRAGTLFWSGVAVAAILLAVALASLNQ